jgi:fatty-acid desaturase
VLAITNAIGIVYNTVWYHRYCSHRAFKFRNLWFARAFLWTNPLAFREESFAIPHRIHHLKSDRPGDPYGPHLGWLGSYLAAESSQKMNRDITRQDFDRLSKSLNHIGFLKNSYEQFRRTGSVEHVWHYGARAVFANLLWILTAYAIGKWGGVVMWISAVFLFSFMLRDFNYRGHGGPFVSACKGKPLNHIYYGVTVGEWHDNHHEHPNLSRSGLTWWQLDIPYWIIRVMSLSGAVIHYNVLQTESR